MQIEYFKRRSAKIKGPVCFYNGAGKNIILEFGTPTEIEDSWGYRLLSENGDILRLVEKVHTPEQVKDKITKAQKVIKSAKRKKG